MFRRDEGIGAPGLGLRGPEARNSAALRAPMVSRLTSRPKIVDNSLRVTGWKYPTAINTIDSNSDSAAVAERVGAAEASIA